MRRLALRCLMGGLLLAVGCADVGSGPEAPAAIEFEPFPFPSIVTGDTLRDEAGVVSPVHAIVRNSAGDVIVDAAPRYLYADFNRDSALTVDQARGTVVAFKAATGSEARIAARIGVSLQVLRGLAITVRPDTLSGIAPDALTLAGPDTASRNTTGEFRVAVGHRDTSSVTAVSSWIVRYELLRPANPANDTIATAFLVDENNRPSMIDTTDGGGNAARRVRVRPGIFSGSGSEGTDSLIVRVTVRFRGQLIGGAPLDLAVPVRH